MSTHPDSRAAWSIADDPGRMATRSYDRRTSSSALRELTAPKESMVTVNLVRIWMDAPSRRRRVAGALLPCVPATPPRLSLEEESGAFPPPLDPERFWTRDLPPEVDFAPELQASIAVLNEEAGVRSVVSRQAGGWRVAGGGWRVAGGERE